MTVVSSFVIISTSRTDTMIIPMSLYHHTLGYLYTFLFICFVCFRLLGFKIYKNIPMTRLTGDGLLRIHSVSYTHLRAVHPEPSVWKATGYSYVCRPTRI